MTIQSCVLCRPPEEGEEDVPLSDWPKDGLIYTKDQWKLCKKHAEEVDAEIARRPKDPIKYILKAEPKPFVPKEVQVKPDYNEPREPGQEG